MDKKFRVFATCDIGEAIDVLRKRGYEVEVYPHPEAPPKSLILDRVKNGVDGLITTLRDPIDAEVFEAGKGTLKVVAQIAVGFDNINRADANRYKIPFTHTADVLTEATAEFAFFMMGTLARRMWTAEHLTRDHQWGYWHPYLPFLGDEVTGKTVAVIGTGRIGLAFIKKCLGFDMNVLCYDPAYENHAFVNTVQEMNDLRHARGLTKEKAWIKYVPFEDALRGADFVSVHVPLLTRGRECHPDISFVQRKDTESDEGNRLSNQYIARSGGGRAGIGSGLARELDRRGGFGCIRERALASGLSVARPGYRRPVPLVAALCQRSKDYAIVRRSEQGHGGAMRAGTD